MSRLCLRLRGTRDLRVLKRVSGLKIQPDRVSRVCGTNYLSSEISAGLGSPQSAAVNISQSLNVSHSHLTRLVLFLQRPLSISDSFNHTLALHQPRIGRNFEK